MTAKPRKIEQPLLIDEDASPVQKSPTDLIYVTRTYHYGQEIIRARVARNFYPSQSHAVVEVMNEHQEWTNLTGSDPRLWHASRVSVSQLQSLANELAFRAASIITI
jgi:hypothetical protein